jgi:DNA-binding transcriptional MerR regulator
MKKTTHRLGDVCRLLDLQPYVLRYWETEFPMLRSEESSGANRVYGEPEVALLRRIKTLLYEEGYTIAGAKKKLETEPPGGAPALAATAPLFVEPATGETAAEEEPAPSEPARLDTPNDERIETLRRGVAQALEEARAILTLLEPRRQ